MNVLFKHELHIIYQMTAPTSSRAMISQEKLSELQGTEDTTDNSSIKKKATDSPVNTEEEDETSGDISLPTPTILSIFLPLILFLEHHRQDGLTFQASHCNISRIELLR